MTLTLGSILLSAGIDPTDAQVIRHDYVREHEDTGSQGIHAVCFRRATLISPREYRRRHLGGFAASIGNPAEPRWPEPNAYYLANYLQKTSRKALTTALRWDQPLRLTDEPD